MTIQMIHRRTRRNDTSRHALAALACAVAVLGFGCGGGGGADDANDPPASARSALVACQEAVQRAGEARLRVWSEANHACASDVMACQLRGELGSASGLEACLDAATTACSERLAGVHAGVAAFAVSVASSCDDLEAAEVASELGLESVAGCSGAADLAAIAACLDAPLACSAARAMAAEAPRAPAILTARGVAVAGACLASAVRGVEHVVVGDTGALFDGIVDGFPGIAPHDGVADVAGNSLGVGLKLDATEERGIAEFPLSDVVAPGVDPARVERVTLTFNIDDVLSTFGPGTNFDGTAAERVSLYAYAGNGTVGLDDFQEAAGTPAAVVDTTSHGVITDATLAASGPLEFEVDVTSAVLALVGAGATHLGFVFTTDDNETGTSLDDLGPGGSGPPGTGGARLPFLTVTTTGEPRCGDGHVDAGEACDDGAANSATRPDACRTDCTAPGCGDRVVDGGEQCDDGNRLAGDGCDAACTRELAPPRCGDGVRDPEEECDAGADNSDERPDACRGNCTRARCGDGVVDSGEECDAQSSACGVDCRLAGDPSESFVTCQDGFLAATSTILAGASEPVATCLRDALDCALRLDAGESADACFTHASASCADAAAGKGPILTEVTATIADVCQGRPVGDLVGALGFQPALDDCRARGLPAATLVDLAACVADVSACALEEAQAVLAPRGLASARARQMIPAALRCLVAP